MISKSFDSTHKRIDILARKYNWFSSDESIEWISDYIKISYVFCYWTIYEVFEMFKSFDYVENDTFAIKERRKYAVQFFLIKKSLWEI